MMQRIMASKEDMQALDKKVRALDTKVTAGFERIAHLLLAKQKREIEDLKIRIKHLEDAPRGLIPETPTTPKTSRRSLATASPLCYNMVNVDQSPAVHHLRENQGTATAIPRPGAVFL
jgi:hypothetical protein